MLVGVVFASLALARGQSPEAVPELVVERLVAAEVARTGVVRTIPGQAFRDAVPGVERASVLARALQQQIRGDRAGVQETVISFLTHGGEGDAPDLVASLFRVWLDSGVDRDGRVVLVGLGAEGRALGPIARALDLAQSRRCADAVELLDKPGRSPPTAIEAVVLEARTWTICAEPARALAVLAHARDARAASSPHEPPGFAGSKEVLARSLDPRLTLAAGQTLLRAGDADSAATWCRMATGASEGLPRLRHAAAMCSAAADALRGLLPSARDALVDACGAALDDPALPLAQRREAGWRAAWVATRSGRPEAASLALAFLTRLDALATTARARRTHRYLRVIALTILERQIEAKRELRRAGRSRNDPELEILSRLASSRLLRGEGDAVAASTELTEAVALARREGLTALLASIAFDRAELARWEGRRRLAQRYAIDALEAWPGEFVEGRWRVYADPSFARRAMQFALVQGDIAPGLGGARASGLLTLAAEMHALFEGRVLGDDLRPDAARVRRQLAARNSGLIYYLIGETKSYAWLVDPGGVRVVELAAGDELFRRFVEAQQKDRSIASSSLLRREYFGVLLDGYTANAGLMICPDAFLAGMPWAEIESAEGRPLGTTYALSIVASLESVVDPSGASLRDRSRGSGLLAVIPRGRNALLSRAPLPGFGTFFDPFTLLEVGAGDLPEIAGSYRRSPPSILHMALPLEAAGRAVGGALFALPPRGPGRVEGVFSFKDVFRADLECDLLVLSPPSGWSVAPASRARAGFSAVEGGARAAVVPLRALLPAAADEFWPRYYEALHRGLSKVAAVAAARAALPQRTLPGFQVVGQADTQLRAVPAPRWPVWAALGGALALILIVIMRLTWRRSDPFDVEPPEEVD